MLGRQKLQSAKTDLLPTMLLVGLVLALLFSVYRRPVFGQNRIVKVRQTGPVVPDCREPAAANKPIHWHILIDTSESASDNDEEKSKEKSKRLVATRAILSFALGYGWLTNAKPVIHIYQFPSPNDLLPHRLWPENGHEGLNSVSPEELSKIVDQVGILDDTRKVEDLAGSLEYIVNETDKLDGELDGLFPVGRDHIVIIVTHGSPLIENEGLSQITEKLQEAKTKIPAQFPVLAMLFGSGKEIDIYDKWKQDFYGEEQAETYLTQLGDNSSQIAWQSWKHLRLFFEKRYPNSGVVWKDLGSYDPVADFEAPSLIGWLRVAVLQSADENSTLSMSGSPVAHEQEESEPALGARLRRWNWQADSVLEKTAGPSNIVLLPALIRHLCIVVCSLKLTLRHR